MKTIFLMIFGLLINVSIWAGPSSTFYYYERGIQHEISLQKGLLADFSGNPAMQTSNKNAVKLLQQNGNVRIWRYNPSNSRLRRQMEKLPATSPVFKDSYNRLIAFPGNLIVYFRKSLKRKTIDRLAKQQKFTILQKLPLQSKNAYIIQTPAGFSALQEAERIGRIQQVLMVTPNIWRKIQIR